MIYTYQLDIIVHCRHYGKWVFSLDTKIIVFVTKVGTLTTGYVLRYTLDAVGSSQIFFPTQNLARVY